MTESSHRLHYIEDAQLSYTRQRCGKGFRFLNAHGKVIPGDELRRIKSLVIPPAWTDVRMSPDPAAHIQAIGYDGKGRKQYIYHPEWIAENQEEKFERVITFGEVLPTIRQTISGHMRQHSLSRERVLATVVWLLDHTFIRVGNTQYAKENQSYGLTTLREKHVDIEGNTITFSFKGKSGAYHELNVTHPRVAKTIKQCIELPGYEVFKYLNEDQERQRIDSRDVNEYLQEISGESLSAKDFRTWGGTTLAGHTLYTLGDAESVAQLHTNIRTAVKDVSQHLGNTVPVCRKYYIHPQVIDTYSSNRLVRHFEKYLKSAEQSSSTLSPEEYATWTLLH
jgi:DNA topoisomerase-1